MTDIFGIAKRLLITCNDRTCNDITCNDRIVLLFLPVKLSTLKIVDKLRKRKITWKYKHVSTIEIYTCFNPIFLTNILPASLIHIYVKSFDTLSGTLMPNSNIQNILKQRDLLFIYDYNKHSHVYIMKQDKLNRPEKYNSIEWFLFEEAQLRICINDEIDVLEYLGLFIYL